MPVGRPGRGRWNEEGTWGFVAGRVSEGLGVSRVRGISRGSGHELHLETQFPLSRLERREKR